MSFDLSAVVAQFERRGHNSAERVLRGRVADLLAKANRLSNRLDELLPDLNTAARVPHGRS
ncbi:hypothetical protein [Methylobacterium nigriterrae]|uniref:hypothetical protein n=1 Tax=Methylobacterium nigriterrae TaxID=3127512 RepID=UPI0030140FD2